MKQNKGNLYCLIRTKNNISAKNRLFQCFKFYFGDKFVSIMENRIKIIEGDIAQNSILGVNNKNLSELVKNVNIVINSGAIVKHFGKQEEFENINVKGTNNIIKFCKKYGKRLMHISTISVSGTDKKDEQEYKNIFTENKLYIGQDFTNIYVTTKFEAEIAVLEAIYDGLDAQILRIGNIANRYSDGVFQNNVKDNGFAKRLKSFIEIGAFPEYFLKHEIEVTPVDLAANSIIKILNYSSDCNMFHIANTHLLSIKEFVKTLNKMGINIIPVSDILMNDIINGILVNETRKEAISGILQDLDKNKRLIYTSSVKPKYDFTEKYLKNIGFRWKKIDKNYIIKYFNYFKKIGFINF